MYITGQAVGVLFVVLVIVSAFVELGWRDVLWFVLFIALAPLGVAALIGFAEVSIAIGKRLEERKRREIERAIERQVARGELFRRADLKDFLGSSEIDELVELIRRRRQLADLSAEVPPTQTSRLRPRWRANLRAHGAKRAAKRRQDRL